MSAKKSSYARSKEDIRKGKYGVKMMSGRILGSAALLFLAF